MSASLLSANHESPKLNTKLTARFITSKLTWCSEPDVGTAHGEMPWSVLTPWNAIESIQRKHKYFLTVRNTRKTLVTSDVTYSFMAYCDMWTHFWTTPEIRERNNWKGIARSVFYVVRAMPIARQRVAKHIPVEINSRKDRLLLGNGAVNRLFQKYRLCFPWCPCKVFITVKFQS
jgi:hypothetical protein